MKVLLVHNRYRYYSGEDFVVDRMAELLKGKGVNVCMQMRDSRTLEGTVSGKLNAFITGIYSLPAYRSMLKLIRKEKPDVVHIHNLYPLFSPSVLVACKQASIAAVMTCHNYRLVCPIGWHFRDGAICEKCIGGREYWCILKNCRENIFESIAYAIRNSIARKLEFFKKNVTIFISPSNFVKCRLIDAGFPADRIRVTPHFVMNSNSNIDHSGNDYIAYSGRVSPEKGISTLLASARKTKLQLHLAGDYTMMPGFQTSALSNVKFLGHISQKKLGEFYKKARFAVIPSICSETFGMVALEAMGYSLPVIASRIGALPEIVEDGVTGYLFQPGDVEDLAYRMKLLWDNPELCKQMGDAGRKKVIRDYNENIFFDRLLSVYEQAINIENKNLT